ncbi:MAG TPA: lysophospholipid acyltransferase family protein [Terracidiphilus sp.]|nr:lysophospholipid acyltransferase family protein [Terracidiphilus sp.]
MALVFALSVSILRLGLMLMTGPFTPERRGLWFQATARRVITSLGVGLRVNGQTPACGLVVSNHLSHIDAIIYAAIVPSVMVAKAEISSWPVIGMMARACGTLFVDRSSRSSALAVTEQVAERLKGPLPVLFFPEGTSTDGSEVLRFHSRLFSPAVEAGVPVTTATIRYVIDDGTPERELCWFGDALLVPHLWKALGVTGFFADVHFGEPRVYHDRREAADETHDEIVAVRSGSMVREEAEMLQPV